MRKRISKVVTKYTREQAWSELLKLKRNDIEGSLNFAKMVLRGKCWQPGFGEVLIKLQSPNEADEFKKQLKSLFETEKAPKN